MKQVIYLVTLLASAGLVACAVHDNSRNTTYEEPAAPPPPPPPEQASAEEEAEATAETAEDEGAAAESKDETSNAAEEKAAAEDEKVAADPEAQPSVDELPEDKKAKPPVLGAEMASGKPKGLAKMKGTKTGIWIWQQGANWNVVTTAEKPVVFRGRITSGKGLKNVKGTKNELKDRMKPTKNEKGFTFALKTGAAMDGFRFRSEKNACVRFQFRSGGRKSKANTIFLGKELVNPPGHLFRVCPDSAEDIQPVVETLPEKKGAAPKVEAETAKGKPKEMKKQRGKEVAYWIFAQGKDRWQIATTSSGSMHEFQGRVVGKQAPLTKLKAKKKEFNDRFKATKDGKGFFFRFRTGPGMDGATFSSKGNTCVRFRLKVDGKDATADQVHLGKEGTKAPGGLFKICNPEADAAKSKGKDKKDKKKAAEG